MLPINYSFPTNLPPEPWRVCYYIPELHKWNLRENLDTELMLLLCDMLMNLSGEKKRYFKVQSSDGRIFEFLNGMNIATLLKFFSNTLSGRKTDESNRV